MCVCTVAHGWGWCVRKRRGNTQTHESIQKMNRTKREGIWSANVRWRIRDTRIATGLSWSTSGARQSSRVSQRAFSSQSSEKMVRLRSYKPTHNGRSVCVGQHNKGRMACCFLIKNVKGLGFKHHSFFFTSLLHSAFVMQVPLWHLAVISLLFFVFFNQSFLAVYVIPLFFKPLQFPWWQK